MERDEIVRTDFPVAPDGYERRSVEAHLEAVAAAVAALEARIAAQAIEREALSRSPGEGTPDEDDVKPTGETMGKEDVEVAARLVALKLVLDGAPRDEVVASVGREFTLEDPEALVDEVIAKAG